VIGGIACRSRSACRRALDSPTRRGRDNPTDLRGRQLQGRGLGLNQAISTFVSNTCTPRAIPCRHNPGESRHHARASWTQAQFVRTRLDCQPQSSQLVQPLPSSGPVAPRRARSSRAVKHRERTDGSARRNVRLRRGRTTGLGGDLGPAALSAQSQQKRNPLHSLMPACQEEYQPRACPAMPFAWVPFGFGDSVFLTAGTVLVFADSA
jgi:hypothetical protein